VPAVDRRSIQNFEWPLLTLALLLALIGVVNQISAAPGDADAVPALAWRQLAWLGVSLVALAVSLLADYRSLERFALPTYLLVLGMLILVLLFAPIIKGSQRWLVLGPARIQPSELAKLALILIFARLLKRRAARGPMGLYDLALPALLLALPVGLVLRQPDLGTAMLIAVTSASFLLVARVKLFSILCLFTAGLVSLSGAWVFYLHDYQKERVLTFLHPERDPLGSAYHAIQSQIAIGSGGLLGRGFLDGPQSQLDFLPEQQTDFVFSVLGEEWGFVGGGVVLLLYLALLLRGLLIARASKDLFGSYLALGVVALLFWAGAINVGMVLGMLPVVGVPLPLISHGGSSLLTCMLGIGLLMNVSMRRYVF
jgi:rod shape determining protein RodA